MRDWTRAAIPATLGAPVRGAGGQATMGWRIVERRIGKAGGERQQIARQREWNQRYGEDLWAVGYVIDGVFVRQLDALDSVYARSYEQHFTDHPGDLAELIALARVLRNPHAEATTGVAYGSVGSGGFYGSITPGT